MEEHVVGVIMAALVTVLIVLEFARGYYRGQYISKQDWAINLISIAQDSLLIRPLIAYSCAWLFATLLPSNAGALESAPFWPAFIIFLFGTDFLHYWVHRWAHSNPVLWKIHSTHHSAGSMSVLMTARLNILWQFVIPANYLGGLIIYLGMDEVFWSWFLLRAVVNFLSHSNLRWDLALYRSRLLTPLVWLFEHIITTPDAHHAHHGYGNSGQPMGNYAPTIILWDFVFGTARLPHRRQDAIGIEEDHGTAWYEQLWWPVLKRKPSADGPA